MTLLTERREMAKALNFGRYPVLEFDLDTKKGSKVRVKSAYGGTDFSNCELLMSHDEGQGGVLWLMTMPTMVSASVSVHSWLECAEYANAPIVESHQEVAILFHSKKGNVAFIKIMKSGKVDASFSTATKFKDVEAEKESK